MKTEMRAWYLVDKDKESSPCFQILFANQNHPIKSKACDIRFIKDKIPIHNLK